MLHVSLEYQDYGPDLKILSDKLHASPGFEGMHWLATSPRKGLETEMGISSFTDSFKEINFSGSMTGCSKNMKKIPNKWDSDDTLEKCTYYSCLFLT